MLFWLITWYNFLKLILFPFLLPELTVNFLLHKYLCSDRNRFTMACYCICVVTRSSADMWVVGNSQDCPYQRDWFPHIILEGWNSKLCLNEINTSWFSRLAKIKYSKAKSPNVNHLLNWIFSKGSAFLSLCVKAEIQSFYCLEIQLLKL